MSSLPRAIAASAALHVGVLGLFALAPEPRPHRDAPIDVQIVMLPAGGAGEGGGSSGDEGGKAIGGGAQAAAATGRPEPSSGSPAAEPPVAAPEVAPRAVPAKARAAVEQAQPVVDADPPEAAAATTPDHDASSGAMDAGAASSATPGEGSGPGVGSGDGTGRGSGDGSGSGHGVGDGDGAGNGSGDGAGDGDGGPSLRQQLAWHTARCYPRAAQRRRTEGLVEVRFCLDDTGHPRSTEVLESSGSSMLDDAATDCVIRSSAPFAMRDVCITAPIDFRLR